MYFKREIRASQCKYHEFSRSKPSSVDRNATENITPRLLIWNDEGACSNHGRDRDVTPRVCCNQSFTTISMA